MHQEERNQNEKSVILSYRSGNDICGNFTSEQMMGSIENISNIFNDPQENEPKYNEYRTLESRKISFRINEWNP